MNLLDVICFEKTDIINEQIDESADDVAKFVYLNPTMFPYLSDVLLFSFKWPLGTLSSSMEKWGTGARLKCRKNKEINKFIEKMQHAFRLCKNEEEKNALRGLIPEKLLFEIIYRKYQKNCDEKNEAFIIETGCIVKIYGVKVIYYCCKSDEFENENNSDKTKVSVDLGVCNELYGEYAEAKVSPKGFHTKDIKYLRKLASELMRHKLNYKIYLVTTGDKDIIIEKLKDKELWNPGEFVLIGSENFYSLAI